MSFVRHLRYNVVPVFGWCRRMGNFEAQLFTVVDSILDLLGETPTVTRSQSTDGGTQETTPTGDLGWPFTTLTLTLMWYARTAVFRQWQIIQYRNQCWTMLNTTHSTSVKQSNKSVPTTSGHQRRFLTLTLFWHRSTNPGWSVVVVTCEIKLFWNDFEIISVL